MPAAEGRKVVRVSREVHELLAAEAAEDAREVGAEAEVLLREALDARHGASRARRRGPFRR